MTVANIDTLSMNTVRGLCVVRAQQDTSGYLGAPMDIAPGACVLCQQFLRFDPLDPIWANRDRRVVSEGHTSAISTKEGQ
jgi:transketolase